MRQLVLLVAALGTLLFGSALALSVLRPSTVESLGREIIRQQVQRRVQDKIDALEGSSLVALAEALRGRHAQDLAEIKRRLAQGLPAKVADTVAAMQDPACPCRKAIERGMTALLEGRVADLARIDDRLSLLIRTRYIETAEALLKELRIFTGANTLVFVLLGGVAWVRRGPALQLLLPAAVLLVAAALTALAYLFGQDWLHTILFSDYLGWGYLAYLSVAVALLADIAFNRARVCSWLFNRAADLAGSAVQAVPC